MKRISIMVLLLSPMFARADEWDDLLAKAKKGDAESQFQVGKRYQAGMDVAKDQDLAHAWFLKAAQQDHAKAIVQMGSIYSHGFGVKQDWAESIRWFRKGAIQGDPVSCHNLGLDYNYAHGVSRDFVEAAHWYRLGAEQGQPRCQYNLALLFETGAGMPQSDFEACILYTLASAHAEQARIFGEAKAKEVVERRDRLAAKLTPEQRKEVEHRVLAYQANVAVHPRRFGAPGVNTGAIRGWYIWKSYDPKTGVAEVTKDPPQETYTVRVLPWATTYRYMTYGSSPAHLLPGERVNLFFDKDENHPRGYLVHFQDEICQMKGHGHNWRIVKAGDGAFTAQAMAGDKALEESPRDFVIDPKCQHWRQGEKVERSKMSENDRVFLTWRLRDGRREVVLLADAGSLEAIQKIESERVARELAESGLRGRLQSIDAEAAHVMIFATHWSQAGKLKIGQKVQLVADGKTIEGTLEFRKNRGQFGSGVTDTIVRLRDEDIATAKEWRTLPIVNVR